MFLFNQVTQDLKDFTSHCMLCIFLNNNNNNNNNKKKKKKKKKTKTKRKTKNGRENYIIKVPGNIRLTELQKIVLLGTAHIVRRTLSIK